MSLEVVQSVRRHYPTPLGPSHASFLLELAPALTAAHGREFGLLKKPGGTNILLPDGTLVSQDVVCDRNGIQWDTLADGEGAAIPQWNAVDPAHYTPDPSRFYAVSGGSQPEPGPTPPAGDYVTRDEMHAAIEAAVANAVQFGQRIGLRAWGHPEAGREGKVLCAENGGPAQDNQTFNLTSRSGVGPWESWQVERGQ